MEGTGVQSVLHVSTVLTTLLGSPPPATSRTMATTSLVSGKRRVASLLWTSCPATTTSNAELRPTVPRTTAPAGTVSVCQSVSLLCCCSLVPGTASCSAHWRSRMRTAWPQEPQYSISTLTILTVLWSQFGLFTDLQLARAAYQVFRWILICVLCGVL